MIIAVSFSQKIKDLYFHKIIVEGIAILFLIGARNQITFSRKGINAFQPVQELFA